MAAPEVSDLSAFLNRDVTDAQQGQSVLSVITAMASAYTRGNGFDELGEPNSEIAAGTKDLQARYLVAPDPTTDEANLQSEHNARTPAVSPDAGCSNPNHVETQWYSLKDR